MANINAEVADVNADEFISHLENSRPSHLRRWEKVLGGLEAINTHVGAFVRDSSTGSTFFVPNIMLSANSVSSLDFSNISVPQSIGRPMGAKNKKKAKILAPVLLNKKKKKRSPGRPKGSKNKAK